MIVVFEGIEGAGKTSAVREYSRLTGLKIFDDPERHEPTAFERTAEDWMKTGRQANVDISAMSRIADFVVDRWCFSSMTLDYLRGCYAGDDFYRRLATRTPAVVILLDVEPEVAIGRAKDVELRYLTLELLRVRRERYLEVARLWGSWGGKVFVVGDREEAFAILELRMGYD